MRTVGTHVRNLNIQERELRLTVKYYIYRHSDLSNEQIVVVLLSAYLLKDHILSPLGTVIK